MVQACPGRGDARVRVDRVVGGDHGRHGIYLQASQLHSGELAGALQRLRSLNAKLRIKARDEADSARIVAEMQRERADRQREVARRIKLPIRHAIGL